MTIRFSMGKQGDPTQAPNDQTFGVGAGLQVTIGMGVSGSLDMPCKPGRYYAYLHKRPDGQVFYVGKGTGSRAKTKDHGEEHREYVERYCGGQYTVEIVRGDVDEEDALALEDLLMQQHGATIINRQNFHQPIDTAKMCAYANAFGEASKLRKEGVRLADEGQVDAAVAMFERAYPLYLTTRDNAEYHLGERRFVETPFGFQTPYGNDYVKVLQKAQRHAEIVAFAERVVRDWGPLDSPYAAYFCKQVERSRRVLAGLPADLPRAKKAKSPLA